MGTHNGCLKMQIWQKLLMVAVLATAPVVAGTFTYLNYFTIVGPEADPAGIEGKTANDALKAIVAYGESLADQSGVTKIWVSRGDNSGTHTKEKSLWSEAGYNYNETSTEPWYGSVGSGMGDTLNVASQKNAYTLSDIGTFMKFSKEGSTSSIALPTEEKSLLNVYSVMAVNQPQ